MDPITETPPTTEPTLPPDEKLTGYLLYHLATRDPVLYTLISRLVRKVCLRCGDGFPFPNVGYEGMKFHQECAEKTGNFLLTLAHLNLSPGSPPHETLQT